jgi:hypothetical protein
MRSAAGGQFQDLATFGHQPARLARIGEERNGSFGSNQHYLLEPGQLLGNVL